LLVLTTPEPYKTIEIIQFGRFDPVGDSIENGSITFRVTMMIFFFFTVILLLNVLIALVNDAFNESVNESGSSYWKLVADVIAEVETQAIFSVLLRGFSGSGREYIYYCADDEEVDNFRSRHSILQASDLSPENRFVVESSREAHTEIHSTQCAILQNISEMQRENREMKQELAELKGAVERSRGHDELKQELTELRGLVKDLMLQLRGNNIAT
ncbi:hypothetical protein BGX34_006416, partial [Mortierella sp. NVP85]